MAKERLAASELWSLYPTPKPINSNPIVSQQERYRKIDAAEQLQRRKLGRYGALIGFYLSVPIVLVIIVGRIITVLLTSIQPNDIGAAMFAVFTSFGMATGLMLLGYLIYKKVDRIFTEHLFNGLPVIFVLVTAISAITWSALGLTGNAMPSIVIGLVSTVAAGTLITIPLILMCASKASANTKVIVLLLSVIVLLAIGFVITLRH